MAKQHPNGTEQAGSARSQGAPLLDPTPTTVAGPSGRTSHRLLPTTGAGNIARHGRLRPTPPLDERGENPRVGAVFGALGRTDSPRFVWSAFVASRLLILVFWALMHFNLSDTRYYFMKMSLLHQTGPRQTMIEYPTPVLWFFRLLYEASFHTQWVFVALFVISMMLLDVLFTTMLWRVGGARRGEAVFFWTIFLVLMGPTAYLRFDLATATLAGLALLMLERGAAGRAGVLTGLGAGIKLWPALLWPALLGGSWRSRVRTTVAFATTGIVLVVASVWYAGIDRLMSPLTYQSQRGLQIESLWAVPAMLVRIVRRSAYAVNVSIWNAVEISGPWTEGLIGAAKLAQAVGVVFILVSYALWLRRGRQRHVEAAALMLTVVLMMILTNKTFSPQYVMWLGGPAAAGIAMLPHSQLADDTAVERYRSEHEAVGRLRVITRVLLFCTLLTTLVYPIGYDPLVHDRSGLTLVTLVLATRNLLLLWLFYLLCLWVWHFAWRGQRRPRRRPSTAHRDRAAGQVQASPPSTIDTDPGSPA